LLRRSGLASLGSEWPCKLSEVEFLLWEMVHMVHMGGWWEYWHMMHFSIAIDLLFG
jgi:hypothetical protein